MSFLCDDQADIGSREFEGALADAERMDPDIRRGLLRIARTDLREARERRGADFATTAMEVAFGRLTESLDRIRSAEAVPPALRRRG